MVAGYCTMLLHWQKVLPTESNCITILTLTILMQKSNYYCFVKLFIFIAEDNLGF